MPREIEFYGIYFSPLLPVIILSMIAAWLTAWLMNHYRLSRFFAAPRLAFMAVITIYIIVFGTFVIRI